MTNQAFYLIGGVLTPAEARNRGQTTTELSSKTLAGQLIHIWEGSLVSYLNGFAYAILGIPSVAFRMVLLKMGRYAKISGILLILNAAACILGIAGYVMKSSILSMGTVVGGILFLFALIFLILMFSKKVGFSGQTKNTSPLAFIFNDF